MKISGSTVAMQSRHLLATRHEESESLRAWIGRQRPDFEGASNGRPAAASPPVQISAAGKAAEAAAIRQAGDDAENDPLIILLKAMVEWLTGKPVKVFDAAELRTDAPVPEVQDPNQALAAPPARRAGFGIEYDHHAVTAEVEQTGFSAQGVVRTADGREISFKLDLAMSRQHREETNVSVRAGDAVRKDPLVINFGGTAAQLSSQRFGFDLDADGKAEKVPLLAGNSGYLALDINGNGRIDSGAELFGPASGSGFAELAEYDQDGDGWIDENDPVFRQLRVWTPGADGGGALSTLPDHKVGALYLGHAGTAFALRGQDDEDLGAVRDSGVYLSESGQAGSLQQVDLSV